MSKNHLTRKQSEALTKAYVAIHVKTQFSPDPDAVTGPAMVVLENKGYAYRLEVVNNKTYFRLTAKGQKLGAQLYTGASEKKT